MKNLFLVQCYARSSYEQVFFKISVREKITGKHLCWSLFLIELKTLTKVLSCEICKISKNTFLQNIPVAACVM